MLTILALALALLLQTPQPKPVSGPWPARLDGTCWAVDEHTPYTGPTHPTSECLTMRLDPAPDTAEADRIIRDRGACAPNNSGGWMADGPGFIQFRTRLRDHPEFKVLCFPPGPWLLVADGQVWTPGAEPGSWVLATPEQMPTWLREKQR